MMGPPRQRGTPEVTPFKRGNAVRVYFESQRRMPLTFISARESLT